MRHLPRSLQAYVTLSCAAGLAFLVWLTAHMPAGPSAVEGLVFFLLLSLVVQYSEIRFPRGGATTAGFAVDFGCILIYGPAVAAWVGALTVLVLKRDRPWYKVAFNASELALTSGLAGLAYQWAGGVVVTQPGRLGPWHAALVPLLVGSVVYIATNVLLVTGAVSLEERRPLVSTWMAGARYITPQFFALAPFGVLMAMIYQVRDLRYVGVALFLLPLSWARYAFKGYAEMRATHDQTVQALANALEAYDPYTEDHSDQVTELSELIAKELGFPATRMDALLFAARLHDIGKFIMEPVLNKREALTNEDWDLIRRHPTEGERIVAAIEVQPGAASIVRSTHERPDGRGYPDGLSGEQIDVAMPVPQAIQELQKNAGTQFDPKVVSVVVDLWRRGLLDTYSPRQEHNHVPAA
jgi:putative nucleotidyltransferase with HDIG domain